MFIDPAYIDRSFSLEVKATTRVEVELVCKDLAGYRDIESYISGPIDKQMSPQNMAIFMEFRYNRLGEAIVCL